MTPLEQINGYAHVAARYGFEEAVFLHSIMYWYKTNRANNRNYQDGRWWTYNSIKAFTEIFPGGPRNKSGALPIAAGSRGLLSPARTTRTGETARCGTRLGMSCCGCTVSPKRETALAQMGKCSRPTGQMSLPKWATVI